MINFGLTEIKLQRLNSIKRLIELHFLKRALNETKGMKNQTKKF